MSLIDNRAFSFYAYYFLLSMNSKNKVRYNLPHLSFWRFNLNWGKRYPLI